MQFFKLQADKLWQKPLVQRWRRAIKVLTIVVFAAAALFLVGNLAVEKEAPYVYHTPEALPAAKVGVLLGTGKTVKGRPNLYYTFRIDAAAELYHAGKIEKILISGDHGQKHYNEPEDMRDDLIRAGVAVEDIVLDYAGFRTLDSMVRAKKIFQVDDIVVISQEFHCKRALFLARSCGLNAVGYAARDLSRRYQLKMFCRESVARCAAWIDVNILCRAPRYLGEALPISGAD